MAVCLEDIIPRTIVVRPREDDETPAVAGSEEPPGDNLVMDTIALSPIQNPLANGMDEVNSARQFFHLIEHFVHESYGMSRRQTGLTPTTRPDEEIMSRSPSISAAAAQIADWLGRDCQGDMLLMGRVLDRFWSKFSIERFASPDLSSLLLMAYEEVLMEEGGRRTEGLEAWPVLRLRAKALEQPLSESIAQSPMLMTRASATAPAMVVAWAPPASSKSYHERGEAASVYASMGPGLPPGLVEPALSPMQAGDVEVHLISIREMLRRHLQSRPMEYPIVLARVMNIPMEDMDPEDRVRARLAGEMTRSGPRGFTARLWQEVRARQTDILSGETVATPALWGAIPPQRGRGRTWWSLSPRWDPNEIEEKLMMLARWIKDREDRR